MTVTRSLWLAALVSMLALACYTRYVGIYWITDADYSESANFDDLEVQIGQAIAEFGFERQPPIDSELVWFLKEHREPSGSASKLYGAEARMTIAIDLSDLSISIRDLTYSTETDFNQAVNRRIEEHLKSQYGVSGLIFKRQFDILPN